MKKHISSVLLAMLLTMLLTLSVFAAAPTTAPLVVDDADLLSIGEQAELGVRLDQIRDTYQMDVVVVTTLSTDGKTPMAYADDFFDYNVGMDRDGVLLLVSMEDRDWWISTSGACIEMFAGQTDSIGDAMLDDLGAGNYAAAFEMFASECEYIINGELNGYPFDVVTNLLIAIGVGFVVALIATGIMRGKLKSVRPQPAAKEYLKAGSMQITQANEFFLYRTVDRVKKESSSSSSSGSHTSSSGRSHGGSGGKF